MRGEAVDSGKFLEHSGRPVQRQRHVRKTMPLQMASPSIDRSKRGIQTGRELNAMSYGEGAFSAGSGQGLLPRRQQ
jgi:hypothetical protein